MNLTWEQRGCCGEHYIASVDLPDGRKAVLDKIANRVTVAVLLNEKATAPPEVFDDEAAAIKCVESL